MTEIRIKQWSELESIHTWNSLLLGNGASIALNSSFNYNSLYQKACLSDKARKIFSELATENFEEVLRALDYTIRVNKALGEPSNAAFETHKEIRSALITAVQSAHQGLCSKDGSLKPDFHNSCTHIIPFLQRFKTVVTLNYDLTLYWAMLEGNELHGP